MRSFKVKPRSQKKRNDKLCRMWIQKKRGRTEGLTPVMETGT